MNLTPTQVDALRALDAASRSSEPTLWGLPKQTVGALATRGLVSVETYREAGHWNRVGCSTRSTRTQYVVCVGATITPAGRAALG